MNTLIRFTFYSFTILFLSNCTSPDPKPSPIPTSSTTPTLQFKSLSSEDTGIDFNNQLDLSQLKNPMQYVNVYNGGGVATGDFNNDGLADVYFTGNLKNNKLYLNKGDFKFEDITQKAGLSCPNSWSTGATVADVNQDGWLDIYVCRAYYDNPAQRTNQLFINNGDLTFTEKAAAYGINDAGFSIQASFFDYDRDGDLDLFVGNHPLGRQQPIVNHHKMWQNPSEETSDHLYQNNGDGTFSNVTRAAGILNYGWTLGLVTADLNQDQWPDIYVSVDHSEPDRYYLNNQDGTFSEVSGQNLKHISLSSMGVDAADINNDGLVDLTVVEMLSRDNFREKTKMASMDPNKFWTYVNVGYHYQYMRNMMHLNMGGGTFSEIGQMAGMQRTDWSWAVLLADFDNDGWKDLYISNGYYREFLDKDHIKKFSSKMNSTNSDPSLVQSTLFDLVNEAPATRVSNNFFHNNQNLTFTEMAEEVGVDHAGFSSGAAYADFDNDGDLDLVVNNSDDPASIYKNLISDQGGHHYLRIQFAHNEKVTSLGNKATLTSDTGIQFQELTHTRGYQSAVEGVLHFGLGQAQVIKKLEIQWSDGKIQILQNIPADQTLTINYQDAKAVPANLADNNENGTTFFSEITQQIGVKFKHTESYFDDYTRQVLLPHQMSQFGPSLVVGDVNGDTFEDFYVGGANGQAGILFLQTSDGGFEKTIQKDFEKARDSEDLGAAFFDSDGDGDLDLYVVSGGNEFEEESRYFQDRLYMNDGKGNFTKSSQTLPDLRSSGSCVKPFDFDGDGDLDLFVGGRQTPGKYPTPANSYLLENQGTAFKNITAEKAKSLTQIGMVTDATWTDFDQDGQTDLLLVGEWMSPTFLKNNNGSFQPASFPTLPSSIGWWFSVEAADLDNDGDDDYVLGNLGHNYKYQATNEKPFHIYAGDFDKSGTFDIALGYFLENDVLYPVRGRQCSSEQMPSIAEKFPTYEDFGKASIFEVYGEELKEALHYEANQFASTILINKGNGQFEFQSLPNEAQIAPINSSIIEDFDGDGNVDMLIAGNLFTAEVETGRADAGKGLFLKGQGNGQFTPLLSAKSGLNLDGDVKDLQLLTLANGKKIILVANNNDQLEVWHWNKTNDLIGLK